MLTAFPNLLILLAISSLGTFVLLKAIQLPGRGRRNAIITSYDEDNMVFIFEGRTLTDASENATSIIAPFLQRMNEFDAVMHVFSPIFPQMRTAMAGKQNRKEQKLVARNDTFTAKISTGRGKQTKLTINQQQGQDRFSLTEGDVRLAELDMLRTLTQQTPQLIWKEDEKGNILWCNQAYLTFADGFLEGKREFRSWPRTAVFPCLRSIDRPGKKTAQRVSATNQVTKTEHWFDVVSVLQGSDRTNFATDATDLVRAEQERRTFVQTVGKTFAQLSIGLAIFDKQRQLAMFNPALMDLTNLSAEFLSSRPSVDIVLDKLREVRVLPEPKDYKSWKDEFTALEQKAKDGTYCEIWNLPDGQSYRVTGRPHPDGAFAVLFEDVSAEVTLTRRFRSDIETSQAVIDTIQEPIAVFTNSGTLVMSNKAYAKLWAIDDPSLLSQRDIRSEAQNWQNRCSPTLMWSDIVRFTLSSREKELSRQHAVLDDGRQIACEAKLIANSMTLVSFSIVRKSTNSSNALSVVDVRVKNSNI